MWSDVWKRTIEGRRRISQKDELPMSVSHLEVTRRRPLAFDYERVDGRLHFAVDPTHPANARIVDLDRASRDAEGLVRFWGDFVLLQPVDPGRANRRLLYYVVNRGLRTGRIPPPM